VNLRSTLLSLALAGGCIWCIATVQQVHSEEKAAAKPEEAAAYTLAAPVPALIAAQEHELAEAKKALGTEGKPNTKKVQLHAEVLAELFNVRQYQPDGDTKAAAEGKDRSVELIAAAKAKETAKIEPLIGQLDALLKKPAGEAKPDPAAKPAAYKSVATVHSIMESQQDHFDEIKKLINATDKGPDFAAVEKHAYVLAEFCNINSYQKDKEDYKKWAVEAKDLSLALAKAAAAKNVADAQKIYRQIHTKCGECHDKYQ
jgi:hypothetical protein